MASSSVRAASRAAALAAETFFKELPLFCVAATPMGWRWPQRAPAQYAPRIMMMQARSMRVMLAERCTVMVEVPSPNQCAPIIGRRRRVGSVRWGGLESWVEGRLGGAGGWWRWLRRNGGITIRSVTVGTGHVKDDLC